MNDSFICVQCGKERNDFPRGVGKDGSICWECSSLNYYNNETVKVIEKLTKVAKNHVKSNASHDEHITLILEKIADIFEEYDNGQYTIETKDIEYIENTLKMILDKKILN